MTGILASQDYAAIDRALPLFFGGDSPSLPPGRGSAGTGEIPQALMPWIGHLIELDEMAELLQGQGVQLTFEELRGLALLRRARAKFQAEHERCSCGAVNRRGGGCMKCGHSVR